MSGPRAAQGGTRAEVLAALRAYIDLHGYSPTIRELATTCGIAQSTCHHHLAQLIAEGRVAEQPNMPRTLRVIELERTRLRGQRLQEMRTSRGLSQERLAQQAGLSTIAVQQLEQGEREGRAGTWIALADALGVHAGHLLALPAIAEALDSIDPGERAG